MHTAKPSIRRNKYCVSKNKESVYRDRLREAGIEVRGDFFIRVDNVDHFDTINLTSQVCALLLGGEEPPTAVFASNELMAIGVLNAARQLRLEVPRDLSVITQDNTMLSHISVPRLTTIDMRTSLLGAETAQEPVGLTSHGSIFALLGRNKPPACCWCAAFVRFRRPPWRLFLAIA